MKGQHGTYSAHRRAFSIVGKVTIKRLNFPDIIFVHTSSTQTLDPKKVFFCQEINRKLNSLFFLKRKQNSTTKQLILAKQNNSCGFQLKQNNYLKDN